VGNCILEKLSGILKAKGYQTHFTYIGNPVTLLYSEHIPDGLPENLRRFRIEDRLEKRTLEAQFEGISPRTDYDVIFVNYYHEQRPVLRHRAEKYFLHLNFQAVKHYEPPQAWKWLSENFSIVDINPGKYLHRFTGLITKIRKNFPKSSIIISSFAPRICDL
jgi:hypothetical protein